MNLLQAPQNNVHREVRPYEYVHVNKHGGAAATKIPMMCNGATGLALGSEDEESRVGRWHKSRRVLATRGLARR